MSEEIQFDESRHPVPTVEFDYDQVGRALGELETEGEVLERVLSVADIACRFHELATEGLDRIQSRAARNGIYRMRIELLVMFMGRHPLGPDVTMVELARKLGFRVGTVSNQAKRIKAALRLPSRLCSNAGVK